MAAPRSPSPNFHRKSTTSFAHSKENEKAAARPRSPAIQSAKGSKSFMAPTISAASKVTVPSPRKKILQERNESVPPVSEPLEVPMKELAPEIGLKSKMALASPEIYGGIKNRQPVAAPAEADQCPPPYDPKTNYLSPRPQFLHYRPNTRIENYVAIERDGKRLEDSFSSESDGDVTDEKDSEEEEQPSDATTDVDVPPSVTTSHVVEPESEPLDATTHVDVPPLVATCHVAEPESEPLDATTHVDVPPLVATSHVAEPESEPLDATTHVEGPPLVATSHVVEPESEPLDATTHVDVPPLVATTHVAAPESEPLDATTHVDVTPLVATTHVAKPESETEPCLPPRSPRKSKLVPFLVIVAIGFVLVPLAGLHSPSSAHLNDYIAVANVKLYDFAGRFKHLSSDAIAYLTSIDSREVFISPMNITSSAEDEEAMYSGFIYSHGDKIEQVVEEMLVEQYEVEASEVAEDDNVENETIVDDADDEIENVEATENVTEAEFMAEEFDMEVSDNGETDIEEAAAEDDNVENETIVDDADDEIENVEATENVTEAEFMAEEFDMEVSDNGETDIEEAAALEEVAPQVSEVIENVQDFSDEEKFEMEVAENCATHIEEEVAAGQESETIVNHDEFVELGLAEEDLISTAPLSLPAMSSEAIFGLSSAVILIFAVSAFLHVKQGKTPLVTKGRQADKNVDSVSNSYTPAKVPRSQHLGRNKDSMRDLCQPEESSSLTHTYQTRRSSEEEDDDDMRHELRLRRDSTASSMSYGSFTTYERLSAKKGSKEEEVVTPVRRSSRLRSHATSS